MHTTMSPIMCEKHLLHAIFFGQFKFISLAPKSNNNRVYARVRELARAYVRAKSVLQSVIHTESLEVCCASATLTFTSKI